jgi:hypothetical protein
MRAHRLGLILTCASLIALAACNGKTGGGTAKGATDALASATGAGASAASGGYLPDANRKFPERVLWGDEHVHTGWSADAGLSGATLSPEDAVRFARGEEVTSSSGQKAKLATPLDWVAVTDHSDGMGTINQLRDANPEFMADPTSRRWSEMMKAGGEEGHKATFEAINAQSNNQLPKVFMDPKWIVTAWKKTIEVMEKYNDPGKFTAFIAYEWTSNAGGGNNLHRNVIFRDNGDKASQVIPLTTFVSEDPAFLWKWMADYQAKTGGQVLAIPHNGNLSNGRMFEERQFNGQPMTKDWAEARAKWEPLFEYWQYKGQSEVHPSIATTDEFASFELWDNANLNGVAKTSGMLEHEYARDALKNGLRIEAALGANPFKFGAAAGTDTHNGLSTAVQSNFWGKFVGAEPSATRWSQVFKKDTKGYVRRDWTQSAAGYTGVWALANTREAIWDAMKRKETYASTGPRITVRFFGGYDFAASDAAADSLAAAGYAKGVPMGGDLKAAGAGQAPTFLFAAMKDPIGANLDRAQIVKGWVDSAGKTHEEIFDVSWSDPDKRKPVNGKLPPVGDTVDLTTATYKNDIGAPQLIGTFKDPHFDPKQRAFYYLRVLEIPTPRWTAYDAVKYKVKMSPEVTMKVVERAVTSPIWYTPGGAVAGGAPTGAVAAAMEPKGAKPTLIDND